jgi:hypothetical protein
VAKRISIWKGGVKKMRESSDKGRKNMQELMIETRQRIENRAKKENRKNYTKKEETTLEVIEKRLKRG